MNYNIKGTGVMLSDEIRSYIEKRFVHIDTLLAKDSTAHVDVEVVYAMSESGEKFRAEFNLQSKGTLLRAEAHGATLHEAIDRASSELTHEVTRSKKKQASVRKQGATQLKNSVQELTEES